MNREKIIKELVNLNFNVRSKGFDYWIQAIELCFNEKIIYDKMTDIYKTIANFNNVNYLNVERTMRTARKNISIKKYYNYTNDKITNMDILKLIIFHLELSF